MTNVENFENTEGDDQKVHEGTQTTVVEDADLVDAPELPDADLDDLDVQFEEQEEQIKYDGGPIPRK